MVVTPANICGAAAGAPSSLHSPRIVGCIQGAISFVLSENCRPRLRELDARPGVVL